jgi:putative endonuclease
MTGTFPAAFIVAALSLTLTGNASGVADGCSAVGTVAMPMVLCVPGAAQHERSEMMRCRPGTPVFLLARPMRQFYVYILASRYRGTLYVGVTNDLVRRIGEHKGGLIPGFTRRYTVHHLVYFEEYGSILEARDRERVLKRWRREWKFKLIEELNPRWRDLMLELVSL